MSAEIQTPDHYDAVLADLRAKRDQIDQTIALLTALRTGAAAPAAASGSAPAAAVVSNDSGIVETSGMFLGMSIVDAAKKLLALRKRTMSNTEILGELKAGGLVLTGADPLNVVGSVLTRRFNNVGDVVRVGRGVWGLKEWYPGRTFKTKAAGAAKAEAQEADEQGAGEADQLSDLEKSPMTPLRAVSSHD